MGKAVEGYRSPKRFATQPRGAGVLALMRKRRVPADAQSLPPGLAVSAHAGTMILVMRFVGPPVPCERERGPRFVYSTDLGSPGLRDAPLFAFLRSDSVARKISGGDRPAEVAVLGCAKNVAGFPDLICAAVNREARGGCDRILVHHREGLTDSVHDNLLTQRRDLDGRARSKRIRVGEIPRWRGIQVNRGRAFSGDNPQRPVDGDPQIRRFAVKRKPGRGFIFRRPRKQSIDPFDVGVITKLGRRRRCEIDDLANDLVEQLPFADFNLLDVFVGLAAA